MLAAEAPATNPHFAKSRVLRAGLASESGDSALGGAPWPPDAQGWRRRRKRMAGPWLCSPPFPLTQLPTPHPQLKRDLRVGQGAGRWAVSGAGRSDNGVVWQSSRTCHGKSLSVVRASALGRILVFPPLSAYSWRPS